MDQGTGQLVLVRHGETEWSAVDKHTGRTDLPLTNAGQAEAVKAGAQLGRWQFANVYASPLLRARHTATLAGFENPTFDDDLMEWDYGDHEGRTTKDIRVDQPEFSKWQERPPGGESVTEVGLRVDRFLSKITADDPVTGVDGDTVVFAHGHLLAVLIARWLELEAESGRGFPLRTATLTVLGTRQKAPVLFTLNG